MADLGQDLPLVNAVYGLVDHTSGRVKVWPVRVTTGGMGIAPSVLGERYKYNIHLACGIVG